MLIGSRAIAYHLKDFKVPDGNDWDIIGVPESEEHYRSFFQIPDHERIEWHDLKFLNNIAMLLHFYHDDTKVCDLEGLAILYRSHLWRDHKFNSHLGKYYNWILPNIKMTSTEVYNEPLCKHRVKLSIQEFSRGNPNLLQSNDDFFDDSVEKKYDHDFLHELYAYKDRPMFEHLKDPDKFNLAWCQKDRWETLTQEEKVQCVAEEVQVIATERFMVPNDWDFNTKRAYYRALTKVCTTLCSGWFRAFAIDNFQEVMNLYNKKRFDAVSSVLEWVDTQHGIGLGSIEARQRFVAEMEKGE